MAHRYGARHMAWVRSFQKKGRKRHHRKMRRNSWPVGGLVVNGRHHRRRYRRNPGEAVAGRRIFGFQLPALTSVAMTGVGFVGSPMLEGFVSRFLPADLMTNVVGRYAVKIGSVLGLTFLAEKFLGRREAVAVGVGGGLYVGISAMREFAPNILPGMGSYTPMSSYVPLGRPFLGSLGRPMPGAVPMTSTGNVVSARFNRFGAA